MEKQTKIKQYILEKESMKLFTMLSGYFLLVLILYSLSSFINQIYLSLIEVLSLILPIIIYLIKNKIKNTKKKIITITMYLLLVLFLPFLYTKTYDLSIDGNTYHKSAIAYIKNGWNPLYENVKSFQEKNDKVIPIENDDRLDIWMEHYPKASWIISATMYDLTGNIESGKSITLILSIMLLIITYNCLRKIIDKKKSILLSLLVILNPIVLSQFFTYYVDSIMAICFTIELLLLILINPKEKINIFLLINLISIISLFINLKFTGLLCSGVIAATYYFYWLFKYKFKEVFKRATTMFLIVFGIALFIVGSNSYIKNFIDHHNPLYPIIGEDKIDIITTMQPKNFKNKTKIEKYLISTFSKTENITYTQTAEFQNPIIIEEDEIDSLYLPDTRIAGFGPYTGLITVITLLLLIPLSVVLYKKEKESIKYLLLPLTSIILSSLLVGEYWWARYVPQLHLIPLGTILLAFYLTKYLNKKVLLISTLILLIPIFINTGCFLYVVFDNIKIFRTINNDIYELKNMKDLKLKTTSAKNAYGYYYTLKDNGVKYEIDTNIDNNMIYKYYWRIGVEK